jgi:hypothetical protein
VLDAAAGTYAMGPLKVVLRAVGRSLEMTAPQAGTVKLVPRHGGGFGVPGQPLFRVTPRGDDLLLHPLGVFVRVTDTD